MEFKITSIPLFVVFIVQAVFFTLKVTKVIDWEWLWVLSPLWISYAFTFFVGTIAIILMIAYKIEERIFKQHE